MSPQLVAVEKVADHLGGRHELISAVDSGIRIIEQVLHRVRFAGHRRRIPQNQTRCQGPLPGLSFRQAGQSIPVLGRDSCYFFDILLDDLRLGCNFPCFLVPIDGSVGNNACFIRKDHGPVYVREDVVQSMFMKLEILIQGTGPKPGYVGTGVTKKPGCRS